MLRSNSGWPTTLEIVGSKMGLHAEYPITALPPRNRIEYQIAAYSSRREFIGSTREARRADRNPDSGSLTPRCTPPPPRPSHSSMGAVKSTQLPFVLEHARTVPALSMWRSTPDMWRYRTLSQ